MNQPVGCRGIDVSQWQGKIDWAKVRASGIFYAFIRVTKAFDFHERPMADRDSRGRENWLAANDARVARGAYHLWMPDMDPKRQADVFLKTLDEYGAGEMTPVIDVEVSCDMPAEEITDRLCEFVDLVHPHIGKMPTIYTMPSFAKNRLVASRLSEMPLWISHVNTSKPITPAGWKRWDFWQWSWTGRVNGIKGNVDQNVYCGNDAEFLAAYGGITLGI
jgi:lysozyme